ncbi:hypothetical protein Ahy_Scaffold1g107329 isoform C [Arachis hypogaea]|uniref:Uncharacterized protein n=1 Tax=Arachis hypogaea TaxID=3818 RepID=A0A444WV89_ARAHY|nr:hypothetical protein Ahy_Scaffold1g107329 isoform C [Arachis hypogaea]
MRSKSGLSAGITSARSSASEVNEIDSGEVLSVSVLLSPGNSIKNSPKQALNLPTKLGTLPCCCFNLCLVHPVHAIVRQTLRGQLDHSLATAMFLLPSQPPSFLGS